MWLHTFHPRGWYDEWDVRNWSIVLDTEDAEVAISAFRAASPYHTWDPVHEMHRIEPGMTLCAEGYDRAYLEINGRLPAGGREE